MEPEMRRTRSMDFIARIWTRIGSAFESRPATVIGITVGAVIFASVLTYILVEQEQTSKQLDRVTAAFCDGRNPNPAKCRDLFDALLKDPTPEQAKRLKELVE